MSTTLDGIWDERPSFFVQDRERRCDHLEGLHQKYSSGETQNVSAKARDEILELLQALESGELTHEDPLLRKADISQLWGKVAYLNGQLGLGHPDTGMRYGRFGGSPGEMEELVNIQAEPEL